MHPSREVVSETPPSVVRRATAWRERRGLRAPGMYVGPARGQREIRGARAGVAGDTRARAGGGGHVGARREDTWGPRGGGRGCAGRERRGRTWGPRAGGLSRPRQRPPAIFSAPLSGLEHEGVGLTRARRPSGPKRRRARAVLIRPAIPRANIHRKQGRSSPDRGASRLVAGGRWRRDATSPRRACPTYLPLRPPARVPDVSPAAPARARRTSPVRVPDVHPRRACPTYLPLRPRRACPRTSAGPPPSAPRRACAT